MKQSSKIYPLLFSFILLVSSFNLVSSQNNASYSGGIVIGCND